MQKSVGSDRHNADFALLFAEFDFAVAESKEGVISSATDVVARTETGSALTDNDGSCRNFLAAECFDTQEFRLAVATVTAAGLTFLMCHDDSPLLICNILIIQLLYWDNILLYVDIVKLFFEKNTISLGFAFFKT